MLSAFSRIFLHTPNVIVAVDDEKRREEEPNVYAKHKFGTVICMQFSLFTSSPRNMY